MRVVVTGGSGLAGRAVVRDLDAHGYAVTNVDHVPGDGPSDSPAPFKRADLTDLGQVYGCLRGAEAVVHLAAIPGRLSMCPRWSFAPMSWPPSTCSRRRMCWMSAGS